MFDLAKIESGNAEWRIARIDLRAVIEDRPPPPAACLPSTAPDCTSSSPPPCRTSPPTATASCRCCSTSSPAPLLCDRHSGLITVRATACDDAVRVEVRDNGPGIPPEQREIIFEKFRQGGDTLTNSFQGTDSASRSAARSSPTSAAPSGRAGRAGRGARSSSLRCRWG
ncbi:MAG: ATP-binding protein [Chloroflexia bacterium]